MSEFLFNARLNLFNTRREHEWKVIIGALVLLGAVDYTVIEHETALNSSIIFTWKVAVAILFATITWYQWGVQIRNRVDRLAMDELLIRMCGSIHIKEDSYIRSGIDREHPEKHGTHRDPIFKFTYLWAFSSQIMVLAVACLISAFVPDYVHTLPSQRGAALASTKHETDTSKTFTVGSSSLADEALLDEKYSEYADDLSPALSWKAVPDAKSYALIMEDPDTKYEETAVHWLAWNIPSDVTSLPEGTTRLASLAGMQEGETSQGLSGYHGPVPPAGDPPHHYHFQVFALDAMLRLHDGANREALLHAMKGHVLAKGKIVARYARRAKPENQAVSQR